MGHWSVQASIKIWHNTKMKLYNEKREAVMSLPHSRVLFMSKYWGPGYVLFRASLYHGRVGYPSGYPGWGTSFVLCWSRCSSAYGNCAASCSPAARLCLISCSWFLVWASYVMAPMPLQLYRACTYKLWHQHCSLLHNLHSCTCIR